MNLLPLLLVLLLALTNIPPSSQLSAIQTRFPLPGTLSLTSTILAGNKDSIYLFGGFLNGTTTPVILHFNISSESVTQVGSLPNWSYGVSLQLDTEGNLIYLGGHAAGSEPTAIYKFSPSTHAVETVASLLPYAVHYSSSVKYGDNVYIFCGVGPDVGSIIEYNMVTMESRVVGMLPQNFSYVAAVLIGNRAYVFGSVGAASVTSVVLLDLDTFQIALGPPNLPPFVLYPTAVYDGEYIYVIGGHVGTVRNDGVLKLNPESFEWELVPVDNFPISSNQFWQYAPSSVYVQELGRIYMFGGWSSVQSLDRVWYIDLNENDVLLGS